MDHKKIDRATHNPAISVIMPVFNGARYLGDAIQSIRNQSFTDFELLVVDDGSQDASGAIADRYTAEDERIRVIHIKHSGVARARNVGLEHARAPWIAKMDSDDIAHPTRFDRQLKFLAQHPDVVLLGTYAWMVGSTGKVVGKSTLGPTTFTEFQEQRDDVRVNFLNPTVMFSRTAVLNAGGYSEDYPWGEDYELFNRLATNHLLLSLPEPLLYYRIHDAATSTRSMRAQAESWSRVRTNIKRQRAGSPPLTIDEFQSIRRSEPRTRRIRRELRLRSRYAYRKAGARVASGHSSGFLWLATSLALDPPQIIHRLQRQTVLPILLKRLRSEGTSLMRRLSQGWSGG